MSNETEQLTEQWHRLQDEAISLADTTSNREVAVGLRDSARKSPGKDDFSPETEMVSWSKREHEGLFDYTEILRVLDGLRSVRQKLFNLKFVESQLSFDPTKVRIPLD